MKKLVIHQFTNHYSKRYRYYNIFWDNLINRLSERHDIVTDRYRRDAHKGYNPVSFELNELSEIDDINLLECEMVIENLTDNEIQILSASDDLTQAILNLQSNNILKRVLVSQFVREKINHHVISDFREKYHPWIYFPMNEYDFDMYYNKRKKIINQIDKMYFRGTTGDRPILSYLSPDVFFGGGSIGGFERYADEIINYRLALSVAGRGEFCYRDVECMAMGIPIIRFEYLGEMNQPLIPNFHYISIERPDDLKDWMKYDREGNESHIRTLTEKFYQIVGQKDFLNFVSENARKYYEDYLSPSSSVTYTLNLLNL